LTEWLEQTLLRFHAPLAYLIVLGTAFLEGPLLLGFVIPGEVVTILGGVLVFYGNADFLPMAIAAAIGAMGGDSVGYWMGRWVGPWLLGTRPGRWLDRKHFHKARGFLARWGVWAVVLGRFTSGVRVIIPGACGMARMHYGRFLPASVLAGALWGAAFVALGWAAGTAWEKASQVAGAGSLVLLIAIVGGWIASKLIRRARARKRSQAGAGWRTK